MLIPQTQLDSAAKQISAVSDYNCKLLRLGLMQTVLDIPTFWQLEWIKNGKLILRKHIPVDTQSANVIAVDPEWSSANSNRLRWAFFELGPRGFSISHPIFYDLTTFFSQNLRLTYQITAYVVSYFRLLVILSTIHWTLKPFNEKNRFLCPNELFSSTLFREF